MLQLILCHPYTGILYFDTEVNAVVLVNSVNMNIHAALSGIFQSVGYEVPQDLFQLGYIGDHHGRTRCIHVHDKFKMFRFDIGHLRNDFIQDKRKHVLFHVDIQLLHIYLGIIQNVTYLLGNTPACVPDRIQILTYIRVFFLFHTDVGKTDNGIYRRSDLM